MTIDNQQLAIYLKSFEDCKFEFDGVEAWRARQLMPLLGYTRWENFRAAITRAYESCVAADVDPRVHFFNGDGESPWTPEGVFRDATKNPLGGRPSEDVTLTRGAAYLVAMNGDPRKEAVAFAQHYFATAARTLEKIQQRMLESSRMEARKQLSQTESRFQGVLYEHDVDGPGIAKIRSKGDEILFGGNSTENMKRKWKVPKSRPLSDFADEVVVIAKQLGAAMTTHNTRVHNLRGEDDICQEHVANNVTIRAGLEDRQIFPERIDPVEDIKKVERRHAADVRKLTKPKKNTKPKTSRGTKKKTASKSAPPAQP